MKEEITSLTRRVLMNLTVEELEQRLEMQLIHVPSQQDWCVGTDCTGAYCQCDGTPCYGYCGSKCTDCMCDGCFLDLSKYCIGDVQTE